MDANGEVIFRCGLGQLVEDPLDHGRGELLGGEAITATDDFGHGGEGQSGGLLGEDGNDVLIERLAGGARLLATIEHCDGPDGRGQCGDECAGVERPEEADFEQSDLFAR